ncbi:hypothetical protein [Pseudorhodoferax sp. Leaf267]|uniref:hypothetical protein n=1 Tax=Pseudorhodoferax sp. Leaf267 TaxID=1736316 RepID=UPI0007016EE2|nr:hypothetical protein [Pseudorhodoferax sp. Leaf267]KQP17175.1 hypothetical protein ASF43_29455 [Pseudorhodoferax sp. Leaf267]
MTHLLIGYQEAVRRADAVSQRLADLSRAGAPMSQELLLEFERLERDVVDKRAALDANDYEAHRHP